jgi:MFS family permease
VHIVPYLTGLGHSAALAAAALGGTIGVSAAGKVFGGMLADRIGALPTLRLALIVWALAFVLLARAGSVPMLGAFVLLYGLALGTQIAVVPAMAVGVLGTARFGALFGVLQLAAMLASAIGPISSGLIFDATGSYGDALLLWLAAMTAAVAVSFAMAPLPAGGVAAEKPAPA